MTAPKKPARTSPATGAFAVGLLVALASSFVGPRLWSTMETSQGLTLGVMVVAFLLGAVPTYLVMQKGAAG